MNSKYTFLLAILIQTISINSFGQETLERIQAREELSQITISTNPDTVEVVFDRFCNLHYGAEMDSLIYDKFGYNLQEVPQSFWMHSSEESASIAWETNLPAKTYIEYGLTDSYGFQSDTSSRYYYNHLHQLKDLQTNSTYHYRMVSEDERGNIINSTSASFTTASIDGVVYIPGNMGAPPYILDQAKTTYLLTQNIIADSTAIVINADSIILDLGGYTITNGNSDLTRIYDSSYKYFAASIYSKNMHGLTIVNGEMQNGTNTTNTGTDYSLGFNLVFLKSGGGVEIAGIKANYHYSQTHGIVIVDRGGDCHIHHNLFNDKGTQITNRHGSGVRPIYFSSVDSHVPNGHILEYNLIKRARQNGIGTAMIIRENEVYIDSWSTNSFALQPNHKNALVKNNKIFVTGYNAYGSGWSSNDFVFEDNLIHMESIVTMTGPSTGYRYFETWGDIDCIAGVRITNYDQGGQIRNNLLYQNNLIIGNCRGGAEMKAVQLMSDETNTNVRFENNIVKVMVTDSNANNRASCVITHSAFGTKTPQALNYRNSTFISNFTHVKFGDSYAIGYNHHFFNCQFIKKDNHPDYHTFVFAGNKYPWDHRFIDCDFIDGAQYNDVYWKETRAASDYSIGNTICINGDPGTIVTIRDVNYKVVSSKTIPDNGEIHDTLLYSTIRPTNWSPGRIGNNVSEKYNHQEKMHNPYYFIWSNNGDKYSLTVSIDTVGSNCVVLEGGTVITSLSNNFAENANAFVYPNPFNDNISINFKNTEYVHSLTLFDIQGNNVLQEIINGPIDNYQMNTDRNLHPGMYFLKIKSNKTSYDIRLIKK